MSRQESKLLLNDRPAVFGRRVGRLLGPAEATVLQTLHWHIAAYEEKGQRQNSQGDYHRREYFHDGHWWYRGTYKQMAEDDFDFLPFPTLRKILCRLEDAGYVISQETGVNGSREGKRFRLNHEALDRLVAPQHCADLEPDPVHYGQGDESADPVQTGQGSLSIMDREGVQTGQGSLSEMDRVEGRLSLLESLESTKIVLDNNKDNSPASEEAPEMTEAEKAVVVLIEQGIAGMIAEALVEKWGHERCLKQVDWMICRAHNPDRGERAGMLRRAIEQDWAEPEPLAEQRKRNAQEKARMEELVRQAQEQAAREAAIAEESALIMTAWEEMTPEIQQEIENQAKARLHRERPLLAKRLETGRDGPMVEKTLWEYHREIIKERLALQGGAERTSAS